jgi:hypothetical protein
MGVEYCHYLIPRPNSFRPSSDQLAAFVDSLMNEKWIAAPGSDAFKKMAAIDGMSLANAEETWARIWLPSGFTAASVPYPLTSQWFQSRLAEDVRIGFPVEHADAIGVTYPLFSDSGLPNDPYYEIEVHLCNEYVHHSSELIKEVEGKCSCGASLEYCPDNEIFPGSRFKTQCPECSTVFDPSGIAVEVRDGWTGARSIVPGGAIYRFAVAVDCGKCIPVRKRDPIKANREFVNLCERIFSQKFYEVGDIY